MKKRIKLIAIILWVLSACSDQRSQIISEDKPKIEVHLPKEMTLSNNEVINYLKQYIELDSVDPQPKVYKLLIEERDFKTTITINSTIYFETLLNFPVIGYFFLDKDIVVVRARLSSLFKPNEMFNQELKRLFQDNNYKAIFFEKPSRTYDCPVWRIDIKGDSISLIKNVRTPDVQYAGKINWHQE